MQPLRIIFMGTPELAGISLTALLRTPAFAVVAVVTQPDRPKGRSLHLAPSPVKQIALAAGKSVLQPLKARAAEFASQLQEFHPDLIVVAAFGQILPKGILDLPRHGCLNVHTSLLPRYRGAAPIQAALLNGDSETGVTIMKMDEGLDTGDIVSQRVIRIEPSDNAQSLHDRLAQIGADLLVETIPNYVAGKIQPHPQPTEGASHVPRLSKEHGRIDWQLPGNVIWNRVRAFTPWPGAFTYFAPGASGNAPAPQKRLLKIWEAHPVSARGTPGRILQADRSGILVGCGTDALLVTCLQCEGGRRMTAGEFLSGHPLSPGEQLG
jgi:methionyl-tRNA formyltransferase